MDEPNKLGIKVDATSVDLAAGKDLLREEPYRSHKQAAEQGVVDGYHAGFPCNTFTKLRWRKAPNMPPPLRSKKYPYGLPGLSHHHKDECSIGTIFMARAIGMVDAVHRADRCAKVPSFATLENPPPSDHEGHISAWHMPEMVELVDRIDDWKCAHFNTCAYESDLPLGTKHYKPQMVGGTLPGICSLNRVRTCGNKTHEPIVGKDKSSKSAAYPWEFCQAYGELTARHFMNMAKTEFLEGRLILLEDRITFLKENAADVMNEVENLEELTKTVERSSVHRRGLEHKRKMAAEPGATEEESDSGSWGPSEGVGWSRSSSGEGASQKRS